MPHHRIDSCSCFIPFYSLLTLLLIYQDSSCLTNTATDKFLRRAGGPPPSLFGIPWWRPSCVPTWPLMLFRAPWDMAISQALNQRFCYFFCFQLFMTLILFVFFVSMLRCQLSRLRSQMYSLFFIFSCFFSHYMVYLLLCRYRGANCVHLWTYPTLFPFLCPLCFVPSHAFKYHTSFQANITHMASRIMSYNVKGLASIRKCWIAPKEFRSSGADVMMI